MILLGADDMVADFVAKALRMESGNDFGKCAAMGFMRGDEFLAGIVYHRYSRMARNVELSIAAADPRWCTRAHLRALFGYPFEQLNCVRVTAIVAKGNKRSRKLCEGLGFTLEGIVRKGWDGHQSACVYGMLKAECRWIDKPMFKRAA